MAIICKIRMIIQIFRFCFKLYKIDMLRKAALQHLTKHLNTSSQVLMRADFNVPVKDGKISDPTRITSTIPTIQEVLKHNPKSLVMLSHLGRPDGKKNQKMTLKPVADQLSSLLNRKVTFLDDCVGDSIVNTVNKSNNEIFLCENVRFHPEQQGKFKDDQGNKVKCSKEAVTAFRNQLTKLGNVYVNDAFGTAHRAHSSVVGIAHKYRVAGLLMQKQIQYLGSFLQQPKKPVLVVLGGSKVTDKLQLIMNMLNVADQMIIGGGMGYPFLQQVFGYKLGITRVVLPQNPKLLHQVVQKAKSKGVKMHFAVDCIAARQMKPDSQSRRFQFANGLDPEFQSFDVGPSTRQKFGEVIKRANSIFWNGPVGVFQIPQFRNGSESVMRNIINKTKEGAISIVGGGDSVSLINTFKEKDSFTFISTGGGASLQLMQGNKMPGIESLSNISDLE